MKKLRLEFIVVILSLVIFISIFEEVTPLKNQDLNDKIVEYNSPDVEAINSTNIYVTGIMMDDSPENFADVLLNISAIGLQGQTVASKMVRINRMQSNSNTDYNVTFENNSQVVAGNVNVINATEMS